MVKFAGFERSWPRPRIKCNDCQQPLVLKWGDKNRPHFSHIGNTSRSTCKSVGEGLFHIIAKQLIFELLNNKCILKIILHCKKCNMLSYDYIELLDDQRVELEYKYNNHIFDIAILENDNIIHVIEVLSTHKTQSRNDISWFEIKANDIIETIGEKSINTYKKVELKCHRDRYCESPMCYSMIELASLLGYGEFCFVNEHVYNIRKAMCKCQQPYFEFYEESKYDKFYEKHKLYWNLFLKRYRCMCCDNTKSTIKMHKPYCYNCWNDIHKGKNIALCFTNKIKLFKPLDSYCDYPQLSQQEVLSLRNEYKYLNQVENWDNTFENCKCVYCQNELLNNQKYPKYEIIWWFGKNKKICTNCLMKNKQSPKIKNYLFDD